MKTKEMMIEGMQAATLCLAATSTANELFMRDFNLKRLIEIVEDSVQYTVCEKTGISGDCIKCIFEVNE